ncbi:MAG TPA: hypothetical protein VER55_11045, partial [Ardenticatenaceae bacterium]|nr:hypothetical protein [Ardenticatenaceae bacterium]
MTRCIVFTLALLLVGSLSDASPTHAEGPALQRLTRADGLSSNGVTALAPDGETLYIGTLAGLDQLRGAVVTRVDASLPDQHVTALLSHRGVLWVGTGAGLARRASGSAWESWTGGEAGLTNAWITSVAPGGWVGTYGGGVLRFREQNPGGSAPRFAPIGRHGPAWVSALATDGDEVWAGTTGEGLWHWDGTRWARFRVPGEVGAEAVTALLVGARQHVWVGTRGGLWLFEPGQGWRPALIAQPVRALAYGSSGLLVAAGQTLYLSATGDLPHSFSAEASWTQVAAGLHGVVSALEADADATWLATLGGGLQRLGTPIEVHSARLPVVLVHGYSDAPRVYLSQFHFLARWLRQDGWPVFYASGLSPEKPLLDNATALEQTIAAVRAQTGAERVLLVAHSFGGLTARVYVGS